MPISEMCSVCSPEISYDFVIKFENLEKEEKYFLERLELDKTVLKQWENKNEAVNFSTSEVTITENQSKKPYVQLIFVKDIFILKSLANWINPVWLFYMI